MLGEIDLLGVRVTPGRLTDAVDRIKEWIDRRESVYVCVCGVHGVMECVRSSQLRRIFNSAGMVTTDGMPLVILARRSGFPKAERVYGPDLMLAVMERGVALGWRHYFYGGAQGIPERLAANLQKLYPRLQVVGMQSPPYAPVEELCTDEAAMAIDQTEPHIVWVGLSTPKQELWMASMRSRIRAPVLIGVGAAFDFHAGAVRQAPRWMMRWSLEWAFRLMQEPRRLWRRYLINNPWFLFEIVRQRLGWPRRPPIDDSSTV